MLALKTHAEGPMSGLADRSLLRHFSCVGGRWVAARSGASVSVTDPATGDLIGHVTSLSAEESREAVDAADAAFPAWARMLPQARAALLRRYFTYIVTKDVKAEPPPFEQLQGGLPETG